MSTFLVDGVAEDIKSITNRLDEVAKSSNEFLETLNQFHPEVTNFEANVAVRNIAIWGHKSSAFVAKETSELINNMMSLLIKQDKRMGELLEAVDGLLERNNAYLDIINSMEGIYYE